jgi:hypothetical protein
LWIGDTGRIVRGQILTSTGDDARDALLSSSLRSLDIDEPPPSDLRQPVTLLLTAGAVNGVEYCFPRPGEPHRADIVGNGQ